MKRITLILVCVLWLSACLPNAGSGPIPPTPEPVLVPSARPTRQVVPLLSTQPQRVLLIGSLFAQDIDQFLMGLAEAANPTAALEVASIILPAT